MKTVLCHGVFDLLHFGHLEHLRNAKLFGNHLVVSVVADRFLSKRQPIYPQDERMHLLRALRFVDDVVLCNAPGPQNIIDAIRPHVYVRGSDYIGKEMPESAILKRLSIPTKYTDSCSPRTSEIIARILETTRPK